MISLYILQTCLLDRDLKLQKTGAVLRGPDDKQLGCKGTIDLMVYIGEEEEKHVHFMSSLLDEMSF